MEQHTVTSFSYENEKTKKKTVAASRGRRSLQLGRCARRGPESPPLPLLVPPPPHRHHHRSRPALPAAHRGAGTHIVLDCEMVGDRSCGSSLCSRGCQWSIPPLLLETGDNSCLAHMIVPSGYEAFSLGSSGGHHDGIISQIMRIVG